MLSEKRQALWNEFLEKYEAEFKAYLGYGKSEIEKIGINDFFDMIGWDNPNQLNSFKTDRLHIVPCIECGNKFAIFEDGYGLCEECQQKYDLDDFSKFYNNIADSQGLKAANALISGFFASPEYRKAFTVKSNDTPEYSLVKKGTHSWRIVPLENLLSILRGDGDYQYRIVLHDQSYYIKDENDVFDDIKYAEELAKEYPAFFTFTKTDMV